jgi:hypothetical protein
LELSRELELELTQTQMAQKPVLRDIFFARFFSTEKRSLGLSELCGP